MWKRIQRSSRRKRKRMTRLRGKFFTGSLWTNIREKTELLDHLMLGSSLETLIK